MIEDKSGLLEEVLFSSATALPVAERENYLRRACDADPVMYARVVTLLNAVDGADQFLDYLAQRPSLDHPGEFVEDYQLVAEIGEGGGGVVYLAEQLSPIQRQVALKVLRAGLDTRAVINRFEAERQALAMMDHPNIAQVFDAGTTSSGRPYFVMELVRGIRITEYCEQCRLDVEERVTLFIQICHAIQHAHHKGIVHRDIKPTNVLVTLHDGLPVAKVIDFGIAKALNRSVANQTVFTVEGHFIGTPAYVSPEQSDPRRFDVDTRSDIYTLGVLLYELLTGSTPHEVCDSKQAGTDPTLRTVWDADPMPPSKLLRRFEPSQVLRLATSRKTSPDRLIRSLRGDLDWIVLRCMEKEPRRRYQTAHDLASDLQRYLDSEPVAARPTSSMYSLSKFARRHRLAFVSMAAVVGVLVAATAFSTWSMIQATRAEKTAEEVVHFLQSDLLGRASPDNEPDRDLKLRVVLDRAAASVGTRFSDRPFVEGAIRQTLGNTYSALGEHVTALPHLQRALDIYRDRLGLHHDKTLTVMTEVVSALSDNGRFAEAEELGRVDWQAHRQVFGTDHPRTLTAMGALASVLSNAGDHPEAIRLQTYALTRQREILGNYHRDTLNTLNHLSKTYMHLGKYAEIEALLVAGIQYNMRTLGAKHRDTMAAMSNLAYAYAQQGRYEEAEKLQRQVLANATEALGEDHPDTITVANNLALTYVGMGNLPVAIDLMQRNLDISMRTVGHDHPDTLIAMNNLAANYRDIGRLTDAEGLQVRALRASRERLGADHPTTLGIERNLASIYERQGKFAQAEGLLKEGLVLAERALGRSHPSAIYHADKLGALLLGLHKAAEAEVFLRSAHAEYIKVEPDGWRRYSNQSRLGSALMEQQRYADAEQHLIDGFTGLRKKAEAVPVASRAEISAAGSRVVELYSLWGKLEKVGEWKALLAQPGTRS